MAIVVLAAFGVFVLFGLSRWAHLVRARPAHGSTGHAGSDAGAVRAMRSDMEPDGPLPFGRGTAWLAVRGRDPMRVARVLGLRTAAPANWSAGLAGSADGLFVAALGEFVCAIGVDAWQRGDLHAVAAALRRLSAQDGEAFWFLADERTDRFGWAMALAGEVHRAFCYDGLVPEVVWDEGPVTVAEGQLGFFVDDPRDHTEDPIKWWPTGADVVALAAAWSVDPRRPPVSAAVGLGQLGRW